MRRFLRTKTVLLSVGIVCAVLVYLATRGNVRWRIHQHYPTADVRLQSESGVETSFDGVLLRSLGINYLSPFEPVAVGISDSPAPVEFRHFRGMSISYLRIQGSPIPDIQPLLTEYRPVVSIVHCDLRGLSKDQKAWLHDEPDSDRYRLVAPEGQVPRFPGGVGLHSLNFYP